MEKDKNGLKQIIRNISEGEVSDISFYEYGIAGREANLIHKIVNGEIKIHETNSGYDAELILENKNILPGEVLSPHRQRIIDAKWQIYDALSIYAINDIFRHKISIHLEAKPSD